MTTTDPLCVCGHPQSNHNSGIPGLPCVGCRCGAFRPTQTRRTPVAPDRQNQLAPHAETETETPTLLADARRELFNLESSLRSANSRIHDLEAELDKRDTERAAIVDAALAPYRDTDDLTLFLLRALGIETGSAEIAARVSHEDQRAGINLDVAEPMDLPTIRRRISAVTKLLLEGSLEPKTAKLALYALQTAAVAARIEQENPCPPPTPTSRVPHVCPNLADVGTPQLMPPNPNHSASAIDADTLPAPTISPSTVTAPVSSAPAPTGVRAPRRANSPASPSKSTARRTGRSQGKASRRRSR